MPRALPSTALLMNHMRRSNEMIRQNQHWMMANGIHSTHGKRDLSLMTPVHDLAGNVGLFNDLFANSVNGSGHDYVVTSKKLALRSRFWMTSEEVDNQGQFANKSGECRFVAVQDSDGVTRFYPTVAY